MQLARKISKIHMHRFIIWQAFKYRKNESLLWNWKGRVLSTLLKEWFKLDEDMKAYKSLKLNFQMIIKGVMIKQIFFWIKTDFQQILISILCKQNRAYHTDFFKRHSSLFLRNETEHIKHEKININLCFMQTKQSTSDMKKNFCFQLERRFF